MGMNGQMNNMGNGNFNDMGFGQNNNSMMNGRADRLNRLDGDQSIFGYDNINSQFSESTNNQGPPYYMA